MDLSLAQWRPAPFQQAVRGGHMSSELKPLKRRVVGSHSRRLWGQSFIARVFLPNMFYVTLLSYVWLQPLFSYKDTASPPFLCLPASHYPSWSCSESVKGRSGFGRTVRQTRPDRGELGQSARAKPDQLREDRVPSAHLRLLSNTTV